MTTIEDRKLFQEAEEALRLRAIRAVAEGGRQKLKLLLCLVFR